MNQMNQMMKNKNNNNTVIVDDNRCSRTKSTTTTTSRSSSKRSSTVQSFKVMDVLQRANELETKYGRTIYHCEVGQPESGAPKRVAQAAIEALSGPPNKSRMGYTDAFGLVPLRQLIAGYYENKYGIQASATPDTNADANTGSNGNEVEQSLGTTIPKERIGTDRIVVTTGSSGGFLLAFTACFDVGDVVAIASSGYPCYRNILHALGCKLVSIPVNDEFKLTARELREEIARRREKEEKEEEKKNGRIKGLILSSPSNPTGAMLSPKELKELCELCEEEEIRFLSDEIYHGISYDKKEATALSFSSSAIVINSFSKYYSMSGWRLGWMVLPSDLISCINVLQQNMFINAPTISQTAAMHCWDTETLEELEGHVKKYRVSREYILIKLKELDEIDPRNVAPADGGFYVYVDLGEENVHRESGLGSTEMCRLLLEEMGVAFTPGTDFEDPANNLGNRRFRISYAGGTNTIQKAMELFHRFWPTWVKRVKDAAKTC